MKKTTSKKFYLWFEILLFFIIIASMSTMIVLLKQSNIRAEVLNTAENDRAVCDSVINSFMSGSDYLTNESWLYAVDHDPQHMTNYWNEVNVTRSRDIAVQTLLHYDMTAEEETHVLRAKAYSDNLIHGETWAQKMISISLGISDDLIPIEVKNYTLSETDSVLSAEEKFNAASNYLMGESYLTAKTNIRSMVQSYHDDLSLRLENETAKSLSEDKKAALIGDIVIVILVILMAASIIFYTRSLTSKNHELEIAYLKAEASSEAKSVFTSKMSHEIRTPLNAVLGYIKMAKEDNDEEERNNYLSKCETAAKNLLSILNDVLDLSAIENSRIKLDNKPFSMKAMLNELNVVYESIAKNKGISFTIEGKINDFDSVSGDRMRSMQILQNLLSNALKFTVSGGVKLSYDMEKELTNPDKVDAIFEVSDTGIGMDKEFLNRIFEPYEQANAEIGQKYGGTGLGLSIVKNLAEFMGGSVKVESKLNEGSTFTVIIPYDIASSPKDVANQETEEKVSLEGMKILLVEDNKMNLEIATYFLKEHGAEIIPASNGKLAFNIFKDSDPMSISLILMDIQMPVMDGYEATKAIRSLNRYDALTVPIVAMTANAFDTDIDKAMKAGMNAHIAKPFDPDMVIKTISNLKK